MSLERFAEKSAEQLVAAIEESKKRPLSRLLNGLGIRHVGEMAGPAPGAATSGRWIADGAVERGRITSVRGVGEIIAPIGGDVLRERHHPEHLVEKLRAHGVNFLEPAGKHAVAARSLAGMTVVITGTLPTLSRQGGHRDGAERTAAT